MLARLQQTLVILFVLLALAWGAHGVANDWRWGSIVAGVLVLVAPHAWVLAVEFMLLSRMEPGGGLPRPRPPQLLTAWCGEVRTGLQVFAWRQPFRSRRHRDHLPDTTRKGRRGVLLVHGFVCNRGLWNPWMERLHAADVPYVAVNLEPVFGSIEAYLPTIEDAIRRLQKTTGLPPLVVAHSMGGLAVRAWIRQHQGPKRIHEVITIGSPHHGTWLARFAVTPNTRQMQRHSDWLTALAAQETPALRAKFTSYYSHCDNIVFPASTSMLAGADNRHLPGMAHVHLVYQPAVWSDVARRLDIDSGAL